MAGIPTYERRIGPSGNTVGVARVNLSEGQGLSALGRGIAGAAESMMAVDERNRRLDEQKQEDQAALSAANALSEGDAFWNQRTTELKQGWQVGGEDLRKTSDSEFKKWKEEQSKALPTEKSRMWFDQHAERMRSRIDQDLFSHQDRATTEKVVADTKLGMDADNKVLETSPDRFDEVTQRRIAAISAQSRIPEGKRAEIAMAYLKDAARSVEYGQMKRDPAAFIASRVKPQAGAAPAVAEPNRDALFAALLNQESGGRQTDAAGQPITSSAGAIGIAQIMPATGPEAAELAGLPWDEKRLRTDAEYNKALGSAYFAKQLDTFGGDVSKALAAYNAGPGATRKAIEKGGDNWLANLPAETQNYVKSITAKAGAGEAATQPQLTANAGLSFSDNIPKTFAALDQHQQYQLIDEAQRLVSQGQAQRKGDADRLLGDALAMHKDGKVDPFNLTPEYFAQSYGPIEGPIKAAAYKGGRDMAVDIQNFAGQTDAQIAATLAASKPPEGVGYAAADARQNVRLQAAQQVVKQRQDDPILFAQRNSLTRAAPIDMSKTDQLGAQLNQRIGVANMMSQDYNTPYRILSNGEAAQMSMALHAMPTQAKLQYLDQVRTGLAGDTRAYNSVMGQLAPDSPVTAVAGSILVKQTPATVATGFFGGPDVVLQPRNVAALMLEGEAILNPSKGDKQQDGRPGKFPMPKETDMSLAFNDAVGTAFRSDASGYAVAYQAFKAYYAGAANRKGVLSDALDARIAKEATAAATGGLINYNSLGQVMKPWGIADSDFKDRAAAAFNQAMASNNMKGTAFDNLSAYGLESVGPGRYMLTNGAAYLNGPSGPIVLDLNTPLNTARSAYGQIKGIE